MGRMELRRLWIQEYIRNTYQIGKTAHNNTDTYGIEPNFYEKDGHPIERASKKAICDNRLRLEGKSIEFVKKYQDYDGERERAEWIMGCARGLVDEHKEVQTVVMEAWEGVVEDEYDLDEDWP